VSRWGALREHGEDVGPPVPVHVLRKIAGHADLSTTQRYLHPDRQSVAGSGELLSKHLWSQNGPKLRVV
jgi:hypothetical protein